MIGRDIPWSAVDGHFWKVLEFAPLARVEGRRVKAVTRAAPYATLRVLGPGGREATWLVTHRLDFLHLWQAHRERTITANEELLIAWSSSDRVGIEKLFRAFLPRINVMVYPSGMHEKLSNPQWWSTLRGEEGVRLTQPIVGWRSTDTV